MTYLRPLPLFVRFFGWSVFAILMAGAWLPAALQEWLFTGLGQSILVALIVAGLLWQLPVARDARPFIKRLCLGFVLWLSTEIVSYMPPQWLAETPRQVLEELGYFAAYLAFVWATERAERHFRQLSWLDSLAAPLFVMGFGGYLLLISILASPTEYDSFLPSHLFYLFMDAYLLVRIVALLQVAADRAWRQLIWAWFWAFLGLTMTDLLDTAWWFEWFESHYDDFWQGVYLLPMVGALSFAGWWTALQRLNPPASLPAWVKHLLKRESRIIGFTLLLLVIHLVGYRLAIFEEQLRSPREWFLMAWILGGFVLLQLYRRQTTTPTSVPTTEESDSITVLHTIHEPSLSVSTHLADNEQFIEATEQHDEQEKPLSDSDGQLIARIEAVLEQHYPEPGYDVEAMAASLALSSRQLQRRLKAIADCSPADYLRRFRLLKAADLLQQGHKVAFVAAQTGFQQQSHFGRCFKDMYGCTPGQFAQKERVLVE